MKHAKKITRHFWPLAACAALLVLLAQPAPAAIKQWVGPKPNTLWTTANNWSGPGEPLTGDAVMLTSTTNKTAYYNTTLNQFFIALQIDASGGSTFTLLQTANTLSASIENIGISGKGQFVQSGGTNTNSAFNLGNNFGSTGTYILSGGGNLSTSGDQIIGGSGTGLFNQSGGNNAVGSDLVLGEFGSGTYNLNGGHLQADNEVIGSKGTGTFTQNATSTNIVNDTLTLGGSSGSGTYTMKGGYLQTVDESVGHSNQGTFTQKGGTHLVSSSLVVGNLSFANGTFTQSGGTTNVGGSLILGNASNSNGTYSLLAGSLSADTEIIGRTGTGQFIQSGGTHTVFNNLTLGSNANSSGAYTLNAGQLQAFNGIIGSNGTGVFTQNGGTHTVSTALSLGDNGGSIGTYNLIKGNLQANAEIIGIDGTGTFNQTGGTHTVGNQLIVEAGSGSGTFNLQGGTLSAGTPFVGGTDIQINSGGKFNVKNTTTTVTGDVTNLGTVKTTNATVTWNGNFGNVGAYISDPSTQTFNQDLNVLSSGYLVGGSQDLFIIKGDFDNKSISGGQWNTILSSLKFATGADNIHTMLVPGEDNGLHGQANNFTWGSLNITGQKLNLDDPYTSTSTAFYAEAVIGATFSGLTLTNITNLDTDPINIYYNAHLAANAYLHGLNYNIPGGGQLIAHTPVPPSVLLLGSGLLGLGALGWRRRRDL